jgi:hypothetical protein
MNDYWSILGGVAGAIFSPGLASLVTLALIVGVLIFACFSGSSEADFPSWWGILLSWVAFVLVLVGGVALLIFLVQFEPFAWVVRS